MRPERGRFDFATGRWTSGGDFLTPPPPPPKEEGPPPARGAWFEAAVSALPEVPVEREARIAVEIFRFDPDGLTELGERLGRDAGIAWVERDVLYFTGARTSFALGGQDLDDGVSLPLLKFGAVLYAEHRTIRLHDRHRLALGIELSGRAVAFQSDLAWLKRVRPVARTPRQLPPATPLPR